MMNSLQQNYFLRTIVCRLLPAGLLHFLIFKELAPVLSAVCYEVREWFMCGKK